MSSKNNNPLKMDVIQGIADRPKAEGKMLPSQKRNDAGQHGVSLPPIFTQHQPYGQVLQSPYPNPQSYMQSNVGHNYPPGGFTSFSTYPNAPHPSEQMPTNVPSKSVTMSATLPSKKTQASTSTNDAILDLLTKIVTTLKIMDERTKEMDARLKTVEQNTAAGIGKIHDDLANVLDILNNKDNDHAEEEDPNIEKIKKLSELLDANAEEKEHEQQ